MAVGDQVNVNKDHFMHYSGAVCITINNINIGRKQIEDKLYNFFLLRKS